MNKDVLNLVNSLNKKFGKNAVRVGTPKEANGEPKVTLAITTSNVSLDID